MGAMKTISAIIVAAGKGRRMKAALPKQYLMLGGMTILSRTLLSVDACPEISRILLVIPESDMEYCRETVLKAIRLRASVELLAGGASRQESVYNGLSALPHDDGIVLIHDGVRPFVKIDDIRESIRAAQRHGAGIPGLPVSDTLKLADDENNVMRTVDRNRLWRVQTPQAFSCRLIKDAHERARLDGYTGTDDASLLERLDMRVHLIPGSIFNIKITGPEDMKLAEALLPCLSKDS
jgi:2-C-methyl-D-erythritol 4-phosphate cytidylyltransferase